MRAALPSLILPLALAALALSACHRQTAAGNVSDAYDNRADAVEAQAEHQPNPTARKIYQSRADAIREEGQERKHGLEKAGTDAAPPVPEQQEAR